MYVQMLITPCHVSAALSGQAGIGDAISACSLHMDFTLDLIGRGGSSRSTKSWMESAVMSVTEIHNILLKST